MREIKFRAWDGSKMMSPDYIDRGGVAHWRENCIPESSSILLQFTGLLDKNGKEIYEGDVVRRTYYEDANDMAIVEWVDYIAFAHGDDYKGRNTAGFYLTNTLWDYPLEDFSGVVIVGNKYENSELLEDV
jgi:uncharacterized phage protein (TIGR01671 family)